MSDRFEEAFIQCLKEGVYPGPSNINERYRKDHLRINKLNGEKTKQRLALMYVFGVPYQRGPVYHYLDYGGTERIGYDASKIPEYPYLTIDDGYRTDLRKPELGYRKHEIQDPNEPWKLKRK